MTLLFDLTKRPRRHSYSSIKKYLECPAAYAFLYLQKLPEAPTAAMMRGTRLHKLAEDYMNADFSVPVPYDVKKIGLKLYQLREAGALAEAEWLLDRDWNPVVQQEDARIKAIVDVHWVDNNVLKLHDYKSGREYPSHLDQLELYAAIGLRKFANAVRAESSAIYIDSGKEGAQRSIIREMLPHIIGRWSGYMDRIDDDRHFLPVGGGHCERCPFGVSKGGPCEAEQRGHKP